MKSKGFLIICLNLMFGYSARTQIASLSENTNALMDKTKSMVLPSPEAQALGKYGDIPLNLSSGTPNITVPFYNWKNSQGNLDLSVGISYNAIGYRVDQNATFVGLGWNLDGYGMVPRAVRGLPDDVAEGFLNRGTLLSIDNSGYSGMSGQYFPSTSPPSPNTSYTYYIQGANEKYIEAKAVFKREYDGEQDMYSISINGLSNKFVIDKNWNVVLLTNSSIKVEVIKTVISNQPGKYSITGFKVIDAKGVIYMFSDIEKTYTSTQSYTYAVNSPGYSLNEEAEQAYASSWCISTITTAFSEEQIQFNYSTSSSIIKYPPSISESKMFYAGYDCVSQQDKTNTEKSSTTSLTYQDVLAKRLTSISLPGNTTINFTYSSSGRDDIKFDKKLDQVEINNNGVSRKFLLTYDYYACQSVGDGDVFTQVLSNTYYNLSKKLRLISVKEISGTGQTTLEKKPYKFYYNSIAIPPVNSKRVDYWGYYLGPDIPAVTTLPLLFANTDETSPTNKSVLMFGTNRSPSTDYVKAGVLEKIEYPTGGNTSFVYETNRCSSTTDYFYKYANQSITLQKTENNLTKSLNFTSPRLASTNIVNFFIKLTQTNSAIYPFIEDCPIKVIIVRRLERPTEPPGTFIPVEFTATYGQLKDGGGYFSAELPLEYLYSIKLSYETTGCLYPALQDQNFNFNVAVDYYYQVDVQGKLAGGLRVSKTVDYDPVTQKSIIKEYEYLNTDGTSSGKLNIIPNFDYYKTCQGIWFRTGEISYIPICIYNKYINRTSAPTQPINGFSGSGLIYERVIERRKNLTGNSLGSTEYTFTPFDGNGFQNFYPYPVGQNYDWQIGLPKTIIVKNADGNVLQSTEHFYNNTVVIKNTAENRSLKSGMITSDNEQTPEREFYVALENYPYVGRSEKTSTVEVVTESGVSQTTTTTYNYSADKYVLKKVTTTNSKGETLETNYYYPQDYSSSVSLANTLLTKNLVGSPLSVETWIYQGGIKKLLKASVEEPYNFGGGTYTKNLVQFNSNVPVSEATTGTFNPATFSRNSTYFKTEAEVLSYNEAGMPKEFRAKDDKLTTLLWDNDKKFVAVQAVNASSIEIAATSFEGAYKGNFEYLGTPVQGGLTGTKSYNLSTGNISKLLLIDNTRPYILSYWTKNSSSFTIAETTGVKGRSYNGWTYYEHAIPASVTSVTISGTGLIDEVRLYPVTAQLTTYTYEPLKGMTSVCDLNNRISYYEYDLLSRLTLIRDLDGNILKKVEYAYQASKETAPADCSGACPTSGTSVINKKCVNGFCETGVRVNTSVKYLTSGNNAGKWKCTFKYRFSDTQYGEKQTEISDFPCDVDE